jgi:UDP-N-acetylglucosamine 4,6-dehydratase
VFRVNVLITGGTGSFGKECVGEIMHLPEVKKVIVFSRDELKQWEMQKEFRSDKMRYFLGDVRDKNRLMWAFKDVDLVIHAAALKQVPAGEYNPFEFVKTNILGSQNVIEAAIERGVPKVMALSTDKAVDPINHYGKTKGCMESLFIDANQFSNRKTKLSVCRYGNVVGSRGSVYPLFRSQRDTGVLTVTHPEMTRFWITLPKAVQFVWQRIEEMEGGEIFVPKMPSSKIVDIARDICPVCEIKYIGIRPGEKLHEVMVSRNESRKTLDKGNFYVIMRGIEGEEFEYTSKI